MSEVRLSVYLKNGSGMTYAPPSDHTDQGSDVRDALSKLDDGYAALRKWLESQLPTTEAPVEHRSGRIYMNQAERVAGRRHLSVALAESARVAALKEAEASVELDGDTWGVDDDEQP